MALNTTLWKINGQTFAALGIAAPRLRYVNGAADTLTWTDPLARFDADLRWPYDTAITLTRGDVVVFRGKVRRTPRFLGAQAESIAYEAQGPWAWLEERAYLQSARFVVSPAAPVPAYVLQQLGRVVLGQRVTEGGASELVGIGTSLGDIITGAAAGVGVGEITGLGWQAPLDEAVDLQTTDALGRILQWAPDAVQWFDYAGEAPAYRAARRADLAAVSLAVPAPGEGGLAAYVPFESISLEPAYKLQAPAVVLFFRRSSDTGSGVWAALERQAAPEGATGTEPRAIVRTLDLAGATPGASRLTQPVKTAALSDLLQASGTVLPAAGEAGNAFNALASFWRRKVPRLKYATLLGFRDCTRVRVPDGEEDPNQSELPTGVCERELVKGAITDWMLDQEGTLRVEEQVLSCRVAFTEVVDGATVSREEPYTTRVTATNAQSRTYTQRGGVVETGEPEEAAMPGLAQKVYDGVKDLHHEGGFVVVEEEATLGVRPGVVINLACAARPEWATMRALVQAVEVEILSGRTSVTVGPPHHLGPQELQELFRSNRTRREVLSADLRVSGRYL